MIFIVNFTVSRELMEVKRLFDDRKGTNISLLLNDFAKGKTTWSVPKKAAPGMLLFSCALKQQEIALGWQHQIYRKIMDMVLSPL